MGCKNLLVRSSNYIKYFYCKKLKKKIEKSDCTECSNKEFKGYKLQAKKPMKIKSRKVSKMAKACDIPKIVKQRVYKRDDERCIFCGKWVPESNACCHYIPRSLGGLGIVENVFTACDYCHREQDNGLTTKSYDKRAELYLKKKYKNWNIENLIYRKY